MIACIFAYFTLLFLIPVRRAEIEQAAAAYDVADTSPQAETARRRISNDTGLTLAPITEFVIIPFWCVIVYAVMASAYWLGTLVARNR
ncbi:hypothetical protein [Novipirellula caenicola]|uniref:Uncharacterized protein n=1 Tax=Novipirellula caenicola TaxID=1536901 RepID=A0ABP9W2Q1_9BACT